jgi:ABC-type uncharacterized transport system involved in gliding motility auxiliary subunit
VSEERTELPGKSVPRTSVVLNLSAMIVLGLILLVLVNYFSSLLYHRGDWTTGGFRELSGKTVAVLESLDQDVDVVVFISQASRVHADLKEILTRYAAETRRLDVEFVDPDIEPARYKMLTKKYNVRSGMVDEFTEMSEQVVVVRSGENTKFVDVEQMTEIDYSEDFMYSGEAEIKGFKAEEALTGAILEVTQGETLTICFAEGHGEWSATSWEEEGIGGAVEFLKRDNYEITSFDLREKKTVPEECAVTVVAGPARPLPADDADKLDTYLAKGGNLLLLLEPVIDGEDILPTGLEGLLEKVGIGSTNALAVETDSKRLLVGQGVGIFVSPDYGEHPIVAPVDKFLSIWSLARPLTLIEGSRASPAALVRTSESSWGEKHIAESDSDEGVQKGAEDFEGPLILGAASSLPGAEPGKGGRLVVYGDVHLLAGGLVDDPTWVNRELFTGAVAWLTEREALISIPPKKVESYEATFTTRDIVVMLVWVLVTIPGLVLIAGVYVWIRRRR